MPTKKPAKGKIIDVTKPGRTPALNNSKHVIVNNTPVSDPMVTQAGGDAPAEGGLMTRTHKLVIQPLHTDIVPEETPAKPAPESAAAEPAEQPKAPTIGDLLEKTAASKDKADEPEPESEPELKPEPAAKPEQPEEKPKPAPAGPVAPAEVPKTPPKTADKQVTPEAEQAAQAAEAAATEQAAHVQALVEKGTYFLPINSVKRRRNHRAMVFGVLVVVVLLVAWLDVALDAGLIPGSASLPHTHFFSAK